MAAARRRSSPSSTRWTTGSRAPLLCAPDLAPVRPPAARPAPPKMICVARNYAGAPRRTGCEISPIPIVFARFAKTLVAQGDPVVPPVEFSDEFDCGRASWRSSRSASRAATGSRATRSSTSPLLGLQRRDRARLPVPRHAVHIGQTEAHRGHSARSSCCPTRSADPRSSTCAPRWTDHQAEPATPSNMISTCDDHGRVSVDQAQAATSCHRTHADQLRARAADVPQPSDTVDVTDRGTRTLDPDPVVDGVLMTPRDLTHDGVDPEGVLVSQEIFEKDFEIRARWSKPVRRPVRSAQADDFSRDFQHLVTECPAGRGGARRARPPRPRPARPRDARRAGPAAHEFELHLRGALRNRVHEGRDPGHADPARDLRGSRPGWRRPGWRMVFDAVEAEEGGAAWSARGDVRARQRPRQPGRRLPGAHRCARSGCSRA